MLYTTFIRLCDEASKHDDCQEFIMTLGWQSWMKESNVAGVVDDLALIFDLVNLDFTGLRKRTGVSMRKFSQLYRIPLRTIESWESNAQSSRNASPYVTDLIRYAVFTKEKEGDDGFIDLIELD